MAKKASSQIDTMSTPAFVAWREKTLTWLLRGILLLATPVLIFGLVYMRILYLAGDLSLIRALVSGVFFLAVYGHFSFAAYAPRLNYQFRAISAFTLLFLLGSLLLFAGGLESNAFVFFLTTVALTAVFLDLRKALIVQVVGLALILGFGLFFISGWISVPPIFHGTSNFAGSWLVQGFNYLMLSIIVLFSVSTLVQRLQESLRSSQQQANHLAMLHDTAFDILAHKEMPELLDALVKRSVELVGATGGLFFIVDEDGEWLTMVARSGEKSERLKEKLARGEGVAGRVLATEHSLLIRNYDLWDERNLKSEGLWGSIMEAPVILGDKVIGVLGCYTLADDLRDFNERDLTLMEGVARQASMAIENIRLIDAAQQAGARLDTIVQTAPSAIISVDLHQRIVMFNHAAEKIFGYSEEEVLGENLNILLPERYRMSHPHRVEEFSRRETHTQPMLMARELLGCRANGEEFPIEVAVSKMESAGKTMMTVIMQDITERKKARTALQKSEQRAQILLAFSKNLEASRTYEEIFQAALNVVEKVLGYRNIWFYLYSDDRHLATLLTAVGTKAQLFKEKAISFNVTEDPYLTELSRAIEPHVIEDARIDPRMNETMVALFRNLTLVHVPAYLMSQNLGLLGMGSFDDEKIYVPSAGERDFLATMASHIAISVDRVKYAEEQKRSEARLQRSHQKQLTLNELLQLALQELPLREKLSRALDVVLSTTQVAVFEKGIIFLADEDGEKLTLAAHKNMGESLLKACINVQMGFCLCGMAAQEKQTHFATAANSCLVHIGEDCDPHSHYSVPILLGNQLQGVLMLHLAERHVEDDTEKEFLETIANTLAGLIDRAKSQEKIRKVNADLVLAYDSTLEGWAKALDLRDKETSDHTLRVAEMTMKLARAMNIPEEQIVHIWRGALLHDIGKMSIPDATLKKEGYLTPEEWHEMQQHPQNAYDMLSSITYLAPALDIPYCHHEKWDGSGYPRGLKGEEIPLAARMFSIVDVWDALSSDRPYRDAWSLPRVIDYIRERSGTQFDPQVVDVFLRLLEE